jgi:RNA polymerase sigma-70 factor (ECF subfamily)
MNEDHMPEMPETEQQLVRKAQNGDRDAFQNIVGQYKKMVYFLAWDIAGNHQDAEDITQDVFIKVFRHFHKYSADSKFSSWLYRIAVNASIDALRQRNRKKEDPVEDFGSVGESTQPWINEKAHNPESQTDHTNVQHQIEKALNQLAPREKTVFVMRHYNDFPLKEIAEILHLSSGSVKSYLFRAVQKIQKELAQYHPALEAENG